ncbi:uncharacterized protein SCHCODRAFT_02638106 [Schizophyllum commune H4-8]|uniref:uncharacterized protein n=1 Tax=Schizophyllum commune (strain H4-8 / FGSC 9210) TaxID=578458 RepID=UPI002160FFB8|nr:uncharacterized protein SCHCODRAFT_02638106 [Schizophyllum commune H4-8]KAI5887430.1 hypothetical protein SCHCODRAFT_02638106 [Schizophyllum commune H4-8]
MAANPDLDRVTARLVAELALEDLAAIEGRRKGKAREDVPPTDEDVAMAEQLLIYEAMLQAMDDFRFAESLDDALEADARVLAAEQAAMDDRRFAEALANGQDLPRRSRAQELAEQGCVGLEPVDNAESTGATSPATPSTSNLGGKTDRIVIECIVCMDDIATQQRVQGPCGHFYCRHCIRQLVATALQDESLWPLRCDNRPLPVRAIRALLDTATQRTFDAKSAELSTPATRRLYCPNATCSHFLGAADPDSPRADVRCPRCNTLACSSCKESAHPGAACGENQAAEAVRALARASGWQTCPECKNIVELSQGCFHMTCRCRAQFCYLCAARWKNCTCRQWDEDRLLDTARLRVENELGAGARQAAPNIFRERVAQRVERLRYNHDCGADGHRWRKQYGGGRCESCHHHLALYLLFCRDCAMAACVRCARNRL